MNLPMVLVTFGIVIVHPISEVGGEIFCVNSLRDSHTEKIFCILEVGGKVENGQFQQGNMIWAKVTSVSDLYRKSAVFPVLFDCCTEVAHHIPRRWLRTVATFDIQNGGDLCKISAVIIHAKHKKLCVSPENRHVKRWMKQVAKGRWRTGHHPRKRKKAKRRRKSGRKEPCPSC